ncbi:hypothetical protein imdm_2319 [gamma proteobacterium IMCC2047]|nr:hypothetical protein imdm_2319 [gamma proteobacterium IMCC2047]
MLFDIMIFRKDWCLIVGASKYLFWSVHSEVWQTLFFGIQAFAAIAANHTSP